MVFTKFLISRWISSPQAARSKDDEYRESLLPPELQNSFSHGGRGASKTRVIVSHAATFLVAMLLSTSVLVAYSPTSFNTSSEPRMKHLHCGNSTAEARANGCVFDVLTNMWVPEQCWDKEGTEEFMRIAPWQGYDMQDGTRRLSLEEMSERAGKDRLLPDPTSPPYWTPFREHVLHCALMWQRQHRGFMSGESKKLDFHSLSYEHTVHCSNSLVHMAGAGKKPPEALDKIAIRTWVGFSECDVEI